MSAAWDVSDFVLLNELEAYRVGSLDTNDVRIHLYKNDYTPVPGSDETDYDEADFTGYAVQQVDSGEWGETTVTDHVAVTTADETLSYTYTAGAGSPQTIYGYYAIDSDDHYLWGERFSASRVMNPGDILQLTPEFRLRTYPYT